VNESRRAFILSETVAASPALCPELTLRLITDACPLWTAGVADLERLGLPDPFWAFAWPGGQALARHLLDHPALCRGRRALDVGTGSGVQAIAALRAGAVRAVAADIDLFALEAASLNAEINAVALDLTSDDLIGAPAPEFDLVLAGDMFYEPRLAAALTAWLAGLACAGATVLVGDPGRGLLPEGDFRRVAEYETPGDADLQSGPTRRTGVYALEPRR
jgi:predicted nicotinamide N-methyase